MDGVLADFETAFRDVELRLFGDDAPPPPEQPESRAEEEESSETPRRRASDNAVAVAEPEDGDAGATPPRVLTRRKLDRVWSAIEETPDFWTTLRPIDPRAVPRIQEMTLRHGWEVFFITQRPKTAGDTVQRQTQRWLIEQGFQWPSVLVMPGPRGKAAAVLHLDCVVDDSPKNCVDVISDSRARALLILRERDDHMETSAKRLGIGIAASIENALDILEQATQHRGERTMLEKLARIVGWRA
jgi:hypothetical protein